MSKRATRELRANLYENDPTRFDETDETILINATKTKNIELKPTRKKKERPIKQVSQVRQGQSSVFTTPISEKLVPCKCNKCGFNVNGILVSYIYSIVDVHIGGMCTPFVTYECKNCNHNGRRSVLSKAMNPDEFDRYYF